MSIGAGCHLLTHPERPVTSILEVHPAVSSQATMSFPLPIAGTSVVFIAIFTIKLGKPLGSQDGIARS